MSEQAKVEPLTLVVEGHGKPVAMACGKCGSVHVPGIYLATPERAMAAARDAAETCCAVRLCDCGAEAPRSYLKCDSCRQVERHEKERARFEGATVVPWDEAAGAMLYDEQNDRWLRDEWEAYDADDEGHPTHYAYATKPKPFRLDADGIVNDALEGGEHYDEARSDVSDEMIDELQSFLDGWCEQTRIVSHFPDYSRVVVFETRRNEAP